MRQRAELLPQVQQTTSQANRPELGKTITSTATRDGGAARWPEPAVPQSLAVDLALLDDDDRRRNALERPRGKPAQAPDANTRYRRHSVPGSGTIARRGLRDAMHELRRCPRGQDCASSCRLVQGAKDAAGQRDGTAGPKLGHAALPWAVAEAAGLFLRAKPVGQQDRARLEKKPSTGKALTVLAHQLARAVSDRLQRDTVFARQQCLHGYGRGAAEPTAALDNPGRSRRVVRGHTWFAASLNAEEPIGAVARSPWRLLGRPLRLLCLRRASHPGEGGCPSPAPGTTWRPGTFSHAVAEDGTRAPRGC
jgi:hypothetical protein